MNSSVDDILCEHDEPYFTKIVHVVDVYELCCASIKFKRMYIQQKTIAPQVEIVTFTKFHINYKMNSVSRNLKKKNYFFEQHHKTSFC